MACAEGGSSHRCVRPDAALYTVPTLTPNSVAMAARVALSALLWCTYLAPSSVNRPFGLTRMGALIPIDKCGTFPARVWPWSKSAPAPISRTDNGTVIGAPLGTYRRASDKKRADSWENHRTGLGTWRDKTYHGLFAPNPILTWTELVGLYHHDDIARRIIEMRPTEWFRRGYELKLSGEDDKQSDDVQALVKHATQLRVDEMMQDAAIWGRLFGGDLLIIGADDGAKDLTEPLNEDKIKSIKWLNTVDRRFAYAYEWYDDPTKENYGTPATYQITNGIGFGVTPVTYIHESRVIRFDGQHTDLLERRRLNGWTYSILQSTYEKMRAFANVFQATSNLVSDASQGVFKMKGLIDAVAADEGELEARMRLVDMSRSVARALLLDADSEEFERVATTFTGLPDLLDRYMMLLAAAADMPVTLLMGRSPAGQNATGDSDFRMWYAAVEGEQKKILAPKLQRMYRLLALSQDCPVDLGDDPEFEIKFPPLWSPSDLEKGQTMQAVSAADVAYVNAGVLTPEEVAKSRFADGDFSLMTDIDVEAREAAAEALQKFDPYENDPLHSDIVQAGMGAGNSPTAGGGQNETLAITQPTGPGYSADPQGSPRNGAASVPPKSATRKYKKDEREDAKKVHPLTAAAHEASARAMASGGRS